MKLGRSVVTAMSLAAVLALWPAVARAEFGPIRLVSKSAAEQADEAAEPALAASGRYLAFQGAIGGRVGVFRKDLASGTVEPVAATGMLVNAADAAAPSISSDGRFVSLTTKARLDPANDLQEGTKDVYVADMSSAPPTYELASARDGCDPAASPVPCGLAYADASGAAAAGRVSLSADGRRVVFVTEAGSNLTGDPAKTETPLGQVALRDLGSDRTILISARRDPLSGAMTSEPVPGRAVSPGSRASLSADGTTVAWLGVGLPAQVPTLSDEGSRIEDDERRGVLYTEPLWRRVPAASPPFPQTRRIVGGGDPLAPGCPAGGTLADPACQGPYDDLFAIDSDLQRVEGWLGFTDQPVPQLSADGGTVALIGNPEDGSDVFVVDMRAGLSRRDAVRALTRWTNPVPNGNVQSTLIEAAYFPLTGRIMDLAISPDGTRIAFATARQYFPLAPPTLITPMPASIGQTEIYQLDLAGEVLERVTPGPGRDVSLDRAGFPGPNAGLRQASSPSYSADGSLLAFASDAFNLVDGDANEESDVFTVETRPSSPTGRSEISLPPPSPAPRPRWRLLASAFSRPNGTIRLAAVVPGAGTLRARAESQLGGRLAVRRVAAARRHPHRYGIVRVDLRLAPRLRRLARAKGGLFTTIRVSFAGRGGKPLHEQVEARFRVRGAAGRVRR